MVDRAYRQNEARLKAEEEQRRKEEEAAELAKKYDEWRLTTWDPSSDDPIPEEFQAIHKKDLDDWWEKAVAYVNTPEVRERQQQEDRDRAEIAAWDAQHSQTTAWDWVTYLTCMNPVARALRGMKNIVMLLVIAAVLILPSKYLLTCYLFGNTPIDDITGFLSIATFVLMIPYAPWYWLITFLPALAICGSLHPGNYNWDWQMVLLFLLWGLYGLIKGIYHEVTWLRESWNDEHHHSTIEHPYLLMGASAGMHYILKKTLGKKD